MSLIRETNAQYYSGQQAFDVGNGVPGSPFNCTFNTKLTDLPIPNYTITNNGVTLAVGNYSVNNNLLTITSALNAGKIIVQLNQPAIENNYGGYEYIPLPEVINNFMMAYVGPDKIISKVKRTDVIFHAKRGLQEFSYDTLKSIKKLEISVPPSLCFPIPQDYVNYVRIGWVDDVGVFHPIKPANLLTQYPTDVPVQDGDYDGLPTEDNEGEILQAAQSKSVERWKSNNTNDLTGAYEELYDDANIYNWTWRKNNLGRRYGLDPVVSQANGWYVIDRRNNKISFSNDLSDKCVIIEYISDGLAYDMDIKIPKMAEEAMYMHIAYSVLAGRANVPEYIVQRFKRDRSAQLRNAKIRLSNMKLGEIIQNMRGKSKWIKH